MTEYKSNKSLGAEKHFQRKSFLTQRRVREKPENS